MRRDSPDIVGGGALRAVANHAKTLHGDLGIFVHLCVCLEKKGEVHIRRLVGMERDIEGLELE